MYPGYSHPGQNRVGAPSQRHRKIEPREEVGMRAIIVMLLMSIASFAQNPHSATSVKVSPAGQSMAVAKNLIDKNPNNCDAYNALAFALSRRARETSNVTFYAQAE